MICVIDGERKEFSSGKEIKLDGKYSVKSISAENNAVVVSLEAINNDWIKEQVEMTGVEPNLFDGV